jgi:protein Mpv17
VVLERLPLHGSTAAVAKIFADQLVWTPPVNMAFFTFTGALEHGDPERAWSDGRSKLWEVLQTNWLVWFPVQGLNFFWVPVKYRVLFVNVVALFWSAYLSYMASKRPE